MANILSDKAQVFLKELHQAVLSTINKDGTPQLTTMWYVLDEDGTIVMNTQVHLQKMKNIRRDSRIAFCVEDGFRYVSINGTLDVNPEQAVVHSDLEKLATRYVSDEATRQEYITRFKSQNRVALRIRPERIIEQL